MPKMEDISYIINTFLKEKKYKEKKEVLGIVFYGSASNGLAHTHSDIDLMIITLNRAYAKGAYTVENKTIEYLELGMNNLKEELAIAPKEGNTYLLSVFQNGKILYDPYHVLEKWKENVIFCYQNTKVKRDIKSNLLNASLYSHELNRAYLNNAIIKNAMYTKTLHEIRKLYEAKNGYSRIPYIKVPILYEEEEKAKQYCIHIPDEQFRSLFLNALSSPKKENIEALWEITGEKILSKEVCNNYKCAVSYRGKIEKIETRIQLYNLKRQIEIQKERKSQYINDALQILLEKERTIYCNEKGIPYIFSSLYEEYEYMKRRISCFPFLFLYEKALTANTIEKQSYYIKKIGMNLEKKDTINPKEYYIKY